MLCTGSALELHLRNESDFYTQMLRNAGIIKWYHAVDICAHWYLRQFFVQFISTERQMFIVGFVLNKESVLRIIYIFIFELDVFFNLYTL